ncbi:MAG TPA: TatD family hydrolase [Candidatus Limnocylindria bacterium]
MERALDQRACLDAHAHLDPAARVGGAGFVLAMTLSATEAGDAVARREPRVVWGVGCHPRRARAVRAFDRDEFDALATRTPVVGEVGLDATSRVPYDEQLAAFRGALAVARARGRVVSVHPHKTSTAVLDELRRRMPPAVILHWWSGDADETRRAVRLGCYFSVHRAVARRLVWRDVPRDRLLVESDIGYHDAPAEIPSLVARTEAMLADRVDSDAATIRTNAWRGLGALIRASSTRRLWPEEFLAEVARAR